MPPKKDNKAKKDSLFLLEVLVDKIIFSKSPCFSDGSFKTCVNVTAPFVEEMEICDDESGITSGTPFVKNFNSGKSCLFFMKEGDIKSAMDKFLINVEVFKTLPCGCLPTKIRLGKAEIDMTKEFVQARNQNLQDPGTASYQALQDTFRIIGEDKSDTAEIIMFLRLSCFGTLIVTKFQGGGGPMSLGTGQGSTVDRSCNPAKPYHTPDDPCICGAYATSKRGSMGSMGQPSCRGGGPGTCPPAQDPYRSMPCTEPEDACFCSGPHPFVKSPLACRNTDAYCLHIPKGAPLSLPFPQEIIKEHKPELGANEEEEKQRQCDTEKPQMLFEEQNRITNYFIMLMEQPDKMIESDSCSLSAYNLQPDKQSAYYSNNIYNELQSPYDPFNSHSGKNYYGKEVTVFMNVWNIFDYRNDNSTQATASVNKSMQVPCNDLCITCIEPEQTASTTSNLNRGLTCQDIYYFRKKGMGCSISKHKERTHDKNNDKSEKYDDQKKGKRYGEKENDEPSSKRSVNIVAPCYIDPCYPFSPCPPYPCIYPSAEVGAAVSHIKIGSKIECPIHCSAARDKNCAENNEEAPVRITNCTNCRRGVFEVVIRRMNGAPLAKNELMLEWTPPPCQTTPCDGFAPPCYLPSSCYSPLSGWPSKCKMIMCRPPRCKRRCFKRPSCRSPCGPIPCGPPVPLPLDCFPNCNRCCKSVCTRRCCRPVCGRKRCRYRRCKNSCPPPRIRKPKCKSGSCSPCSPCPSPAICCDENLCSLKPCCSKPCYPKPCYPKPCSSKPCCGSSYCSSCSPCARPCRKCVKPKPCCPNPCSSPCSPCPPSVRPCPVGYRKRRKHCSCPKVKPHRKRISPCLNRPDECPMPRCKSLPAPCVVPGPCSPCRQKKCCPASSCKPVCCSNSSC